jgi:hypothetical protein
MSTVQVENDASMDLFVTIFDLNRSGAPPAPNWNGATLLNNGISQPADLQLDSSGNYNVNWTSQSLDGQKQGAGSANNGAGTAIQITVN